VSGSLPTWITAVEQERISSITLSGTGLETVSFSMATTGVNPPKVSSSFNWPTIS
jgi:hypothetical protein